MLDILLVYMAVIAGGNLLIPLDVPSRSERLVLPFTVTDWRFRIPVWALSAPHPTTPGHDPTFTIQTAWTD
jgi:hypothetical protein